MEIDAKDMIVALRNQRNGALDENAQLYAMVETLKREVAELKSRLEPPPPDA